MIDDRIWIALAFGLATGCSPAPRGDRIDTRPNFLVIVADDLGYGDIGPFGGEIETPNLDALAGGGVRFTRFYTQVACSPTRSLLLTGVDNHLNGVGTMAEDRLAHHEGRIGYDGVLNHDVVTVARLLEDAGYQTYTMGKWHLGTTQDRYPFQRGFTRTYSLLHGGSNHFTGDGWHSRSGPGIYTKNGSTTERPDGVYSSDLFTNELLDAIEDGHENGRPFFALLSFTAPHFPLQAPPELIEKYAERYVDGWDAIRERRFERMKATGLAPVDMSLPPRIEDVPAWDALSADEQRIEAKKMAIYAAMVDNLDTNVGRVLDLLDEIGEADDTFVIFMSDNGTDPYDRSHRPPFAELRSKHGYDNSFDNMGAANSYIFAGLGWAQVGSVHHRHYKFVPSEGGMHAPMIARFPGVLTPGEDRSAFVSVLDVAPTFLELAGVEHPGEQYGGRAIHPMRGRSFAPYLRDAARAPYGDDDPVAFEIFGHGVVYQGPWKAVRLRAPWDDHTWRLYNIDDDPGEERDLARDESARLAELIDAYSDFAEANGVIDEPEGATAYPYRPGHLRDLIPE